MPRSARRIGGVTTLVGEPQNLLIAEAGRVGLSRSSSSQMAPVAVPVAVAGFATCWLSSGCGWFGYGAELRRRARGAAGASRRARRRARSPRDRQVLIVQAVGRRRPRAVRSRFHVAEVGLIGLLVIVLATAFTGVIEEHRIGKAFEAAMPFTALLVVFFAIVARDPRPAPVRAGDRRACFARGTRAGRDALYRDRRALGDQRQRIRRDDLHHRDQGGVSAGSHRPASSSRCSRSRSTRAPTSPASRRRTARRRSCSC